MGARIGNIARLWGILEPGSGCTRSQAWGPWGLEVPQGSRPLPSLNWLILLCGSNRVFCTCMVTGSKMTLSGPECASPQVQVLVDSLSVNSQQRGLGWPSLVSAQLGQCPPWCREFHPREGVWGMNSLGGWPESPASGSCLPILGMVYQGCKTQRKPLGLIPPWFLICKLFSTTSCWGGGDPSCLPGAWRPILVHEMGFSEQSTGYVDSPDNVCHGLVEIVIWSE